MAGIAKANAATPSATLIQTVEMYEIERTPADICDNKFRIVISKLVKTSYP